MTLMDIESAINTDGNQSREKTTDQNLTYVNIDEIETNSIKYVPDWRKWHGIYRTIPEYKSSIDTYCLWIIGKKLITDKKTKKIISKIKGNGKDHMKKILLNLKRTSKICGDAFAEKIKNKAGRLINLKPLNPGTIMIVGNEKAMINKYIQITKKNNEEKKVQILNEWKPEQIFHVTNERIADEIHGIPSSEVLLNTIKWRKQAMESQSVVIERYGKPTFIYEVGTDDTTEMANIGSKINKAQTEFKNIIVPEGTLKNVLNVKVSQLQTLDPIPWMNFLKRDFILESGTPDIVQGESRESSTSSGELNYISYKEKIIYEQQDYTEDINIQLNLNIKFPEPPKITIESTSGNGLNPNTKNKQQNQINPKENRKYSIK